MKRELRDHSEPCEHGYFTQCGNWLKNGEPHDGPCPGGKLVVMEEVCWCDTHQDLASESIHDDCRLVDLAPTVWVEVTP